MTHHESTRPMGAELAQTFQRAKDWSCDAGAQEVQLVDALEAAALLAPEMTLTALARKGVLPCVLQRLRAAAESRADAVGVTDPKPLAFELHVALAACRETAGGEIGLGEFLGRLAAPPEFSRWLESRYAAPQHTEPLVHLTEALELVGRYHELTRLVQCAQRADGASLENRLAEREAVRATFETRYACTQRGASTKALYEGWAVEPLTQEATAVELVVLQAMRGAANSPLTVEQIVRMGAGERGYGFGARRVLQGLELLQSLGFVHRLPSLDGERGLTDPVLPTEQLLVELDAAYAREPIGAEELASARRWLAPRCA